MKPGIQRKTMRLDILYLEDDPVDVELTRTWLVKDAIQCRMTVVDTREDYIAALGTGCFELILSDYRLPSFDGLTALQIAQEKCPDVPFMFVSGVMGEEIAIESLKHGATDYVLKERLARLPSSVRRALADVEERRKLKTAEAERERLLEREKASRLEAERANHSKDEFLALLSHELRTPLTPLLGWTWLLHTRRLNPDDIDSVVDKIERAVRSEVKLVDDLLEVSRLISGKLRLDFHVVNLHSVTQAAVDMARGPAAEKEIDIEWK